MDEQKQQSNADETPLAISEYEMRRNSEEDRRENLKVYISAFGAIGTFCIPFVLLFANSQLQKSSELRNTREVALQLQSQREQSEAQMKSAMFGKLLDKYQSSEGLSNPLQKIFYLELLVANFGDSLNLSPIINDLSTSVRSESVGIQNNKQATHKPEISQDLYARLRSAIREAGSRQASMLANVGALLNVQGNQGVPLTIAIQHCKEGDNIPTVHYLSLIPGTVEIRNREPAVSLEVAYWNSNWSTRAQEPTRQNFLVESVDIPLIDNLPLRDGIRLAIRNTKPITSQGPNSFQLIVFTQEYSSIKDKPTATEYVDFLTKGPIGQGLSDNTKACLQISDSISIREVTIFQPDPKKKQEPTDEYKYFAKYVIHSRLFPASTR